MPVTISACIVIFTYPVWTKRQLISIHTLVIYTPINTYIFALSFFIAIEIK